MTWCKLQNYTNKVCRKNLWRVEHLGYELDDLMQESWIVYDKCLSTFKGTEDAHFMAYYKTMLNNRINYLSKKDLGIKNYVQLEEAKQSYDIEDEVLLRVKLALAPKSIKRIIEVILNPPAKYIELITKRAKGARGFNNNKLLCAMLGVSTITNGGVVNILKFFKDFLKS